ncbi:MAG: DUF58 domain-containing protein [Gammaproteobacteria bacterium]|nr:DUF58 domain-containing protein [Gammaproteobacteria bacterium]MDH4254602.1 DUF58 domain-containing protein [Gammaproteobacteria bacterium]MDH5309439.1 DUF58 domain-containing protein [Gammaproteobacteria bacterium]
MSERLPGQSAPRGLLQPEVLASLKNLDLVARSVVEGFLVGLHRSPLFGFSQEFAEYRAYAEGDDPRFIDWNVYARTERTYIKRFLGETNSHLMILLDVSASMDFGGTPVSKLRYAQFLAASLAYLANRQHDAVGCMIFDEDIRDFQPASSKAGRLQAVLHSIDRVTPGTGTSFERPFEQFRRHVSRRGLVALVSDFWCDTGRLLESVRPLAWQGQDIVLFQVLDPAEMAPGYRSNVLLEDAETGAAVEVTPEFLADEYPRKLRAHIDSIATAAAASGADHVLVNTGDSLDGALRKYLLFRQRRK